MIQANLRPSFRPILALMLSGFLLPLLIAGCGGVSVTGSNAAPTVTISASPTSVAAGGKSTLTVTAGNDSGVIVTGSDGTSYSFSTTAGGTASVTPTKTTTYTATATGGGGTTVTATATVTVTANAPTNPTVTISASPTTIAAGASSTLTVAATHAVSVTIAGSDGTSYTLSSATGGTQSVTPSATTTYTATATGAAGTTAATETATVTVTAATVSAPTVTLGAVPANIVPGGSSLLTVVATNATSVVVTGTDKSSYTLTVTGGNQAVTPAATTTYTATATGPGGTVTATTTVTVSTNPAPTVTIVAAPPSIAPGGTSVLQVAATNATGISVTGSDGTTYTTSSATGGNISVTPAATTTYTATATGPGGTSAPETATVTVTTTPAPTVSITANPTTIYLGNSSTLTVVAANATAVTIAGSDGSSYTLTGTTGGTQIVTPATATAVTYTATATGVTGTTPATAQVTVTVSPDKTVASIDHVIFMLQENHSFDNYFGMLNPYREGLTSQNGQIWNVGDDGVTYNVDGIDDKLTTIYNQDDEGDKIPLFPLTSTCIDDASSAWLASFGDVNRYDFSTGRSINMDGYVHNAEGYDLSCAAGTSCSGSFTDQYGERAMGYYDQNTLNYYYFMASEYALSDRWFSPVASKSIDNRIATFTGGTTQGLVKDPNGDDKLDTQLGITTIFDELNTANVSWKIYYTVTQGFCVAGDDDCGATGPNKYYPATDYSNLSSSYKYLYVPTSSTAGCTPPTVPSQAVGDSTNSFCIDPTHIAPLVPDYYNDLANGTLPSFAFIEAGYGNNDEHPGSGQPVQAGQAQVAKVINAFTGSTSYADSVFFLAYDEGGGPYDHVPPVPGSSNKYTDPTVGGATTATDIPDIASISVAPDSYAPCVPAGYTTAAPVAPTLHCDLVPGDPGAATTDAAASDEQGFGAQLGFRLPNMVISPFTRRHYVSHIPMDHTAVIKFVESRFINGNKSLTARDAAQPNLLDFFDFNNVPWAVPPTPPAPLTNGTCSAATFGQPVPE